MKLTHETLVIATRTLLPATKSEVLIGKKLRGPLSGMDFFPGGKLDGSEDMYYGARRELSEETGIEIPAAFLQLIGNLIIRDERANSRRFGSIALFRTELDPVLKAHATDELAPRWEAIDNPSLTDNMHPDTRLWWPYVIEGATPLKIHIHYPPVGDQLEVIVKQPDMMRRNAGGMIYEAGILDAQL